MGRSKRLTRTYPAHGITTHPVGKYFDEISESYTGKLFFVVDVSGSMSGARLEGAIAGARLLLEESVTAGFIAGVISFDTSASLAQGLTSDLKALDRALRALRIGGGTDLSRGIELGHRQLKKHRGDRVLALFTDGGTPEHSARKAAHAACADGIRIICEGAGSANMKLLNELECDPEPAVRPPANDTEIAARVAGLAARVRGVGRP